MHGMRTGTIIRNIRREQRKTLEDVAFSAETSAGNLSRIERGQQNCSAELLARIAAGLGVSIARFYTADAEPSVRAPTQASPPQHEQLKTGFDRLNRDNQALTLEFMHMLWHRQQEGVCNPAP